MFEYEVVIEVLGKKYKSSTFADNKAEAIAKIKKSIIDKISITSCEEKDSRHNGFMDAVDAVMKDRFGYSPKRN